MWCCKPVQWSRSRSIPGLVLAAGCAAMAPAAVPDWLREAARLPVKETGTVAAVVLLDEQATHVRDAGEIRTTYRRAVRILRPEGMNEARVAVQFDSETRIASLKAWSISPQGREIETKEKDAVETGLSADTLYSDTRSKILLIPGAEPGATIGYEYEQRRRPMILQDLWWFQEDVPVRRARFSLKLPAGWEFGSNWVNHGPVEPRLAGERHWVWEMDNIAAIEDEPLMPPWRAVAGRLAVNYYPTEGAGGISLRSWNDLGRWYHELAAPRRQLTPEIRAKTAELTASLATPEAKLKAVARFAQRDIRYVAIAIGIGGVQPHAAQEILGARYGDCKDKVTLMAAMLSGMGIESHYVLVNSSRGVVAPAAPSQAAFDHVIIAVRLPKDIPTSGLPALYQHPSLGSLLMFDPTDEMTPLGSLRPALQASHGLLVRDAGGEMILLPQLSPESTRLVRSAKLTLSPAGTLFGDVSEQHHGSYAVERRSTLRREAGLDRSKVLERFLGSFLGNFTLESAGVENMDALEGSLGLHYRFSAANYARTAGDLVLIRPRVLGSKGMSVIDNRERRYPIEFEVPSQHEDVFEINLPAGYEADELPPPMEASCAFASYRSRTDVKGSVLTYQRSFEVRVSQVPADKLGELNEFLRRVGADERKQAVLRKKAP